MRSEGGEALCETRAGRVSPSRLYAFRATRPSSAMIFAMVFTETCQPFFTSLIQIFGEP
ncbi:hypothetical protein QFZ24_000237 [Streptomyces phaeochromogenes]|uniref:hypothetical protein n=1 Tax=Streptomyces phaeochromogenes TaxID=1923 RepID=UPI0027917628|nr:hypothetical protein [Streptomyces phaeochromogenes]MDQ0946314.1 hypothetical protein [Streptomyces phaeochromogenes]